MLPSIPGPPSLVLLLPSVDRLRALVCRGEKCVVAAQSEFPDPAAEAGFGALPAGLAEVGEIAKAGLLRRDEQKIVVVFSAEPARAPAQVVFERSATPASKVLVTTCFSGGSLTSAFGRLHGSLGSAQPSSIAVGARLASL